MRSLIAAAMLVLSLFISNSTAIGCSSHGYVSASTVEEMVNLIPHNGLDIHVSVSSGAKLEDPNALKKMNMEGIWELDNHTFTVTVNGVDHQFTFGAQAVLDALDLIRGEILDYRAKHGGTIYCG